MRSSMSRREFLAAGAAAITASSTATRQASTGRWKTTLYKALIGKPDAKVFERWKAAGFEGMESRAWNAPIAEAEKGRRIAEQFGMRIHSLMRGWTDFNKPEALEKDVASVEHALRVAEAYGADAVLLVPCRIGGMKIPEPWQFALEFDQRTGHVKRVVAGDNSPYGEYIKAHNQAIDASRRAVEKLIAAAEKTGVIIALENVWNNLWVLPDIFAHFVASFQCKWVQAYFDIGNHVKYAPPEQWIRTLGKLIVKCHVKDFKLNPDGHAGEFCAIPEGKALDEVGYNGWMTIEGRHGLSENELSRRLELIIAGK